MKNSNYLLPVGFYDLIGDEAKNHEKIIKIIKESFKKEQFDMIKTPLLEFDDKIDDDSFKTTDILSKRFLKIRNDITPQIIRLVKTKFYDCQDELKLSYIGDVLKSENGNLFSERQITQAGMEIISPRSDDVNFYILDNILNIVEKLSLENILISFSIPQILTRLLAKLDINNKKNLEKALKSKNILNIEKYGQEFTEILLKITLEDFDINLMNNSFLASEKANIQRILNVKQKIQEKYPNITIDIDLFNISSFSFHEDFGFMIFANDFQYPISIGGKYNIADKKALGGSIYVNHIAKIL